MRPGARGCLPAIIAGALALVPLYVASFWWAASMRSDETESVLMPITQRLEQGGTLGDALALARDLGCTIDPATPETLSPEEVGDMQRGAFWAGHVVDDVYGRDSLRAGYNARGVVLWKSKAWVDVPIACLTYHYESGTLEVQPLADRDEHAEAKANCFGVACCAPWPVAGLAALCVWLLGRRRRDPPLLVP